jgi:PAS domain-containing protein
MQARASDREERLVDGQLEVIHRLTFETAKMSAKLAELGRRAQQDVGERSDRFARAALQELSTAIEELHVANEQLQIQIEQLESATDDVVRAPAAIEAFADAAPIAVIWTNETGLIRRVNEEAARLFQATKETLLSTSFSALLTDPAALADALIRLADPMRRSPVELRLTVQPLNGAPRAVRLLGTRLTVRPPFVWFLQD